MFDRCRRAFVVDDDAPRRNGRIIPASAFTQAGLAAPSGETSRRWCVRTERDFELEVAQPLCDIDVDHDRGGRATVVFLRAIHSAATSATSDRMTAITLRRSACASPLGVCV